MAKDRTCILCETVCSSKQEMEEHIRSMLHHRELEKLKGRDCGHECRVCEVEVASLTDYASHISGPSHKQKAEAADRTSAGTERDYFDQDLVDLIHKRKEHVRKEREAAAARLAKEEEERKQKEVFQQRLQEAKDQYRRENHRFGGPAPHNDWYDQVERPWRYDNQRRSATWSPDLQRWASGEFRDNQEWRGTRTRGSLPQNPPSRLPWLSGGGSSNGLYGRNNLSQLAPRGSPMNFSGGPSMGPPWPNFCSRVFNKFQNGGNGHRDQQKPRNGDGQSVEPDRRPQNPKISGTGPKPDKVCRWSPYSVTRDPESVPHSDANHDLPDENQQPEKEPEPCGSGRRSRPEQKPERTSGEDMGKDQPKPTTKPRDSGSGSPKDRPRIPPALLPKTTKPSPRAEREISSVPDSSAAELCKGSDQAPTKSTGRQSPIKSSCSGPLKQSSSERRLRSSPKNAAKELVLEKRGSPDKRKETAEERLTKDQSRIGKPFDGSHNLQSLQVSTSTGDAPCRGDPRKAEAQAPGEAGQRSEGDVSKSTEASAVPGLSRLDLPPVLKRDLTKHITPKSKAVGHEPNLNIARRVRDLSESRRGDSEKDSGLKPTVRQLISSSGSRRNVNWEQVYQEVRKKRDKGRGMPRFGIEMVSCDQEYHSLGEDRIPLLEGFQWESLMDVSSQTTSRKRSLSESSLAPGFVPSRFSPPESKEVSNHRPALAGPTEQLQPPDATEHQHPDKTPSWNLKGLQSADSVLGDSSSGPEQGTAKRRRAALDLAGAEPSCLERHSKRRKVRCKTERLRIDRLLSVSLCEDRLSGSLQTVEASLVRARAALEAAYLEVQRLTVVKQQMCEEMSSLRTQRIQLLQGMRDTVTEEKLDPGNSESLGPPLPPPSPTFSPTSPTSPPLVIKEEPRSPVHISSDMNPAAWTNSPAPELLAESVLRFPPSHSCAELNHSAAAAEPAGGREAPPQPVATAARDGGDPQTFQRPAGSVDAPPPFPSDPPTAKRVRKLRKRKTLKMAGAEPLESTDTELDEDATRPRWPPSRRRASQVSTSSLHSEDGQMRPPQPRPPAPPRPPAQSRPPQPHLACNEVSSTSDLELCKSSDSEMPSSIKTPKMISGPAPREDAPPSQGSFEGHQEAVNALQVHAGLLYTCSGDRTVRVFDLVTRQRVGVLEGHSSKVSCLLVSAAPSLHHRLYSGSSDQTIRCYDLKTRDLEQIFTLPDRVLCLHSRWRTLFAGLANGSVVTFDLKTNRQVEVFECHGPRAISCLASSREGARRLLLVGSYDATISVRDAGTGLLLRLLEGHSKTVLCMKVANDLVFSGSSDQCVHTHNIHTGELLRVYEGHSHAVTVVTVLGTLMVTACLDKLVRVYDLQSHEQLQVYSGHADMVTCMAVHKNMVYTGCYDGSVRAVQLNLTQSYRCWWHGCSLAFGVTAHLQQHLVGDHGGQTTRCRWKKCEEVLGSRCGAKQGTLLLHMQRHAVEDTRVE